MDSLYDIGTVADALTALVRVAQPRISGPSEIMYGIRWEPTVSYWSGTRRVHLWLKGTPSPASPGPDTVLVLEIADISADGHRTVQRCHVSSVGEARSIMQRFLCERCDISQLSGHEWIKDPFDHDKFIPHPPDSPNTGSHARLGGGRTVPSPGSTPSQLVPSLGSVPSQGRGCSQVLDIFVTLELLAALLKGC